LVGGEERELVWSNSFIILCFFNLFFLGEGKGEGEGERERER